MGTPAIPSPVPSPTQKKGAPGFTLLELMLSVVIISLIILIIVGVLRLGFRSVEAGEKKAESLERVRNAITILESQIQSEIPLTYYENAEKKYYFRGGRLFLDMATNYSLWGGEKGYVVVHYQVFQENNGSQTLWVKENIVGQEISRETRMLEQTAEFHLNTSSEILPKTLKMKRAVGWMNGWMTPPSPPRMPWKRSNSTYGWIIGPWIGSYRSRGGAA